MQPRFILSRFSAALFLFAYSALVIFGSLYPFSDWHFSRAEIIAIFFPSQPRYITRTDVLTNVLAYTPLGMLSLWYFHYRTTVNQSLLRALVYAGCLSLTMEILQLGIASRHASTVDWLTNVLGAILGALLAAFSIAQPKVVGWISALRRRWFLPGTLTSMGLAVLVLGLLAEIRPLPQAAQSMLHYEQLLQFALTSLSLALLVALLVPQRIALAGAALVIVSVFCLRALTTLLLYRFNWSRLLPPEPLLGTLAALLIVLLAFRANSKEYKYLAGISVLLLLFFLQWRSWIERDQGGNFFGYWQLKASMFNFTGAAHALSEIWPLLALVYLLAFYLLALKKA